MGDGGSRNDRRTQRTENVGVVAIEERTKGTAPQPTARGRMAAGLMRVVAIAGATQLVASRAVQPTSAHVWLRTGTPATRAGSVG